MHALIRQASFSLRVQRHSWCHFYFVLKYQDVDDIMKTWRPWLFYKTNKNNFCVSVL